MSPDEYQQAWQAQASQTRVTIDADMLLKEVKRSQREFRAKISWNDFLFIGIILVMLPVWIYMGVTMDPPWTWWLMIPAFIWFIGFILVGRSRHKPTPSEPGEPLLSSVKESLALVEHQIWSLRNIVWWYLVPIAIPLLTFTAHVSLLKARGWWDALNDVNAAIFVFFLAIACFIYYLSKLGIRTQYEPRRQELLRLIASLGDETTGEVSGEYPILMGAKCVEFSRRRMVLALLCAVVLLAIGLGGIYLGYRLDQGYPKKSPFAAVQWHESEPQVKIGDTWFKLVSLDKISAAEIVAFCQKTYGDKWQKRFEEDLVEVLAGMGHSAKDTVTLVVLPPGSTTPQTIEDVPMTEANRQNIRNVNQARERREQQKATQNTVSIEDAETVIAKLIPRLREEKKLVGLAAMVVVDGKVIASAVDGERKKGSGVQLAIGDRWHLGSITKSITSTMIARLIEAGKMQWTDSIGECFPDASLHEDWKPVTLRQLLTHTSGAPANFSFLTPRHRPAPGPERTRARREAVLTVLAEKPEYVPGEKHAYSNVGYTIAGAMAEEATGETWEDLVQREVFDPLELKGAGFGPPKSPDETFDQPRGHSAVFGWKLAVGEDDDNTPIIGPAGTVHMTLEDLCTYATEHLRGELGEGKLLSAETYKFLHTPELNNYACGWVKDGPSGDIQHTVYWHNGSNTMWYALVAFIPEKKMVVAVTSNDGDIENAEAAAREVLNTSAHQINVGALKQQDTSDAGSAAPID
ncbi:MAG: serine hydrolase domain-containing protein [Candidatus Hydrogenedentes bacterium]|nr:serine hydrolase domain-containing protein [Candidatus Hydrogenedentota bacterium]